MKKCCLLLAGLIVSCLFIAGCLIVDVSPDTQEEIQMDVGETIEFSLKNIPRGEYYFLGYYWTINGDEVYNCDDCPSISNSLYNNVFVFTPEMAGSYKIRCKTWEIYPPLLRRFIPVPFSEEFVKWTVEVAGLRVDPATHNTISEKTTFTATVYPEGTFEYEWFLDGQLVSSIDTLTITPSEWEEGFHTMKVIATDGEISYTHNQTILIPAFSEIDVTNIMDATHDGGIIFVDGSRLIKMDSNGQSEKLSGTLPFEDIKEIRQLKDGGYALLGEIERDTDNTDIHVAKLNELGQTQWIKSFGGSGNDYFSAAEATDDDGVLLFGKTFSDDIPGISPSTSGIYAARINSQGDIVWQKVIGNSDQLAYTVEESPDNGFLISVMIKESIMIKTSAIKMDGTGVIQWERAIEFSKSHDILEKSLARNVVRNTADGGYIMAAAAGDHFLLAKLDSLGNIEWQQDLSEDLLIHPVDIMQTPSDGYAVVGHKLAIKHGVYKKEGIDIVYLDPDGKMSDIKTLLQGTNTVTGYHPFNYPDDYFSAFPHNGSVLRDLNVLKSEIITKSPDGFLFPSEPDLIKIGFDQN
ncbi:MAG: hypothetical protein KJ737_27480 [Proteobacteria bacterium]|nr:hypothetical protein [Pseudomonadota bacterium]